MGTPRKERRSSGGILIPATAESVDALLEEAKKLTSAPPTPEEVAKAKQSILSSFVFESDSTRKILGQQLGVVTE